MYSEIIGVLGGMGSYATCHLFHRLLDAFPGEKEWDRPQIIINNNCTMPSRVRAILYNENEEQLKEELVKSVQGIIRCAENKKTHIIIGCNTAHHYMSYLREKVPEANFVDIIEACAEALSAKDVKEAVVLATEGVFETKLYDKYFQRQGITVQYPLHLMKEIRFFIERVKQNEVTEETTDLFFQLLSEYSPNDVILGCTELPVVYERMLEKYEKAPGKEIHDPLEYGIQKLKQLLK